MEEAPASHDSIGSGCAGKAEDGREMRKRQLVGLVMAVA